MQSLLTQDPLSMHQTPYPFPGSPERHFAPNQLPESTQMMSLKKRLSMQHPVSGMPKLMLAQMSCRNRPVPLLLLEHQLLLKVGQFSISVLVLLLLPLLHFGAETVQSAPCYSSISFSSGGQRMCVVSHSICLHCIRRYTRTRQRQLLLKMIRQSEILFIT